MKHFFKNAQIYDNQRTKSVSFLVKNGKFEKIIENNEANKKELEELEKDNIKTKTDLNNRFVMPSFINTSSEFFEKILYYFVCDISESKTEKQIINKINDYCNELEVTDKDFILVVGFVDELIQNNFLSKQFLDQVNTKAKLIVMLHGINRICLNTNTINYIREINNKVKIDDKGFVDDYDTKYVINLIPKKTEEQFIKIFNYVEKKLIDNGNGTITTIINENEELETVFLLAKDKKLRLNFGLYLDYLKFGDDKRAYDLFNVPFFNKMKFEGFFFLLNDRFLDEEPLDEAIIEKLNEAIEKSVNNKNKLYILANRPFYIKIILDALDKLNIEPELSQKYIVIESNLVDIETLKLLKNRVKYIINSPDMIWSYYDSLKERGNYSILDEKLLLTKDILKEGFTWISSHKTLLFNLNNFESIWSATNRKDNNYEVINEQQIVSVNEAINSFISNPAQLMQEENNLGKIAEGYNADFVVLSDNPYEIDKKYLSVIKILSNYLDGKLMFKKRLAN